MTSTVGEGAPDLPRRRPRDRKQQILTVARELFVEKGYPNVSMALIAEQVGITAGALYRHFRNKAVLLERVVDDSFSWLGSPITQIDFGDAIAESMALVADRPYLADLWTRESRYLPADKRAELQERMRAWNESLAPALLRRRPDLDPGNVELLLWSIQSMISGIGRQAWRAPASDRIAAVHAGLQASVAAALVPTGAELGLERQRLFPSSMRERLLSAAFQQFNERGYDDTSLASLGAAVDVTGPNLYSHYESKADLLAAVLERGAHALWLGLNDALATSSEPAEAVAKLARSYVVRARYWASSVEDPKGNDDLESAVQAFRREYIAEWVALLVQARPEVNQRQARLKVQLALSLVGDLYSNPSLVRVDTFHDNVAQLVLAVLFDQTAATPGAS